MSKSDNYTRDVDWLKLVRFHKDIAERGDRGFFSKKTTDDKSENWSFILNFEPSTMADSWKVNKDVVLSSYFLNGLLTNKHETLFVGGPSFRTVSKNEHTNEWEESWNPIFYRQVAHRLIEEEVEFYPDSAKWNLSPVFLQEIEKLELSTDQNIEQLGEEVIEEAAKNKANSNMFWSEAIISAFSRKVPELKSLLTQKFRRLKSGAPTHWAVFASLSEFSNYNKFLIKDYETMEANLLKNPENKGGLKCLEKQFFPKTKLEAPPVPLVPLNFKQGRAVSSILSDRPVTVISGPPGCGKSQVVVSLLLNAWSEGQSVLFASNNNKAVDVVKERISSFESDFPVAVRAGNKKVNKVVETFEDVLKIHADAKEDLNNIQEESNELKSRIGNLTNERDQYDKAIKSKIPTRISEGLRVILSEHSEEIESESEIKCKLDSLNDSKPGGKKRSPKLIRKEIQGIELWWDSQAEAKEEAKNNLLNINDLTEKNDLLEAKLKNTFNKLGTSFKGVDELTWLKKGLPESIAGWYEFAKTTVGQDILPHVESNPKDYWKEEFNRWKSEATAKKFSSKIGSQLNSLGDVLNKFEKEIPKVLEEIEENEAVRKNILQQFSTLTAFTEKESVKFLQSFPVNEKIKLTEWLNTYAELITSPKPKWNQIGALFKYKKIKSKLEECEAVLLTQFPTKIRVSIGQLNEVGREKWAKLFELVQEWVDWSKQNEKTIKIQKFIEKGLSGYRPKLQKYEPPSDSLDLNSWKKCINKAKEDQVLSHEAMVAWKKYVDWYSAENKFKELDKSFNDLDLNNPFCQKWKEREGAPLFKALEDTKKAFSKNSVELLYEKILENSFKSYTDFWNQSINAKSEFFEIQEKIKKIPTVSKSVMAWWKSTSSKEVKLMKVPPEWPDDRSEPIQYLRKLSEWMEKWDEFESKLKPNLERLIKDNQIRKKKNLDEILKLSFEMGGNGQEVRNLVKRAKTANTESFPGTELQNAFSHYTDQNLQNKLNVVNRRLSVDSFKLAKIKWQRRLIKDQEAKRCANQLISVYQDNHNELPTDKYEQFGHALRIAPIWITIPASSHSVPMSAGAFDLVVIDEATQCSITNLLPLLYRGKRLAVIGDEEQLRAINIINKSEENLLAKKYDVEEWIADYGHYSEKFGPNKKDVYTVGVKSLPVGLADVVYLREHYRSHPQIIGFSNHRIYRNRLELKRPIDSFSENDGVHAIQVSVLRKRAPGKRAGSIRLKRRRLWNLLRVNLGFSPENSQLAWLLPSSPNHYSFSKCFKKRAPSWMFLWVVPILFRGMNRDVVFV